MKDYQNVIINTKKCDCDDYGNRRKLHNKNSEEYWETTHESMRAYTTKHQTDRLRPLERFLDSQVGKSWDNVYSQLCSIADKRSIRGFHLDLHIKYYVSQDTSLGRYKLLPTYYVDENHLLQKRSNKERGLRWESKKEEFDLKPIKPITRIKVNENLVLVKMNGFWFQLIKKEHLNKDRYMDTFKKECKYDRYKEKMKKFGKESEMLSYEELFNWTSKQLNKRELKKFNLKNDV